MKKILGLIGIVLVFALICAFATGCKDNNNTTDPQIPGIGTTDSTTDASTTDTSSTTAASTTSGTTTTTATTATTTATTDANATTGATTPAATTTAATTVDDPSKLIIFLDPGHGGKDPGTTKEYDFDGTGTQYEKTTYEEADINLAVALKAKAKLEALGYQVILSRTGDTFVEVEDRPAAALNVNAAMFISIHVNSADGDVAHGFEAWYSGKTGLGYDARAFAQIFNEEFEDIKDVKNGEGNIAYPNMAIREYSPRVDTERFTNGLAVLNQKESHMPSTLLELGFLSNEKDAFMLQSTYWQNYAAQAIADGVVAAHAAGIYKK